MLRRIPACISPDLMHAIMSMGHGDEIVFADGDFPAATYSRRLIRADGHRVVTLLEAMLPFFPVDTFVEKPILTMDASDWSEEEPPSYHDFRNVIKRHDGRFKDFGYLKRFDFYDRARHAFAVVATSEPEGNLLLTKGCIT